MEYKKEKIEKSQIKLSFEVTGDSWKEAIKKAYFKTKGKYRIEGFRPGHAPQKMIETVYGKGVFFEDALDIALQECYTFVMENDKEVEPVGRPDVNLESVDDAGAKFDIIVPVKPEVTLGEYKGLTVKKQSSEVSDDMVEAEVKRAQEKAGSYTEITDRAVMLGDKININFSGSVDGVKFEGGTAENQDLVIGSNTFIPGMEEGMIGMAIGEEKDLNVTFPEEYQEKTLAGKAAVFAVKVNSIAVKSLPELDDEFAKDMGDYETIAQYRDSIRARLVESATKYAERQAEEDLLKAICANVTVEIPQAMVEAKIDSMVEDFGSRMQQQGLNMEQYYQYTQSTEADLRKHYAEQAAEAVKTTLVMEAIEHAEGIKADEESYNRIVTEIAEMYGQEFDAVLKMVKARPDMDEYVTSQATGDCVMKFLRENNTIA